MLLPREHLSLSCMDLASPLGDLEYSRFYESNVRILDLESRMGARPVVLIARLESDKTVYALERKDDGLYSLCHLGSWVDLQSLSKHAAVVYSKLTSPRPVPHEPALPATHRTT
jgi:DNA replication regulator SLD3